jgi:membrane-bound metal-dependent hydrolase YbcI (DUF457 family)
MIAVAGGSMIAPRPLLRQFLVLGSVCAVLPDIDAIGRLHIDIDPAGAHASEYYDAHGDLGFLGGHRGFTHSLLFAGLLGIVVSSATLVSARWKESRLRLALFIAAATAAHGGLDALATLGALANPVQFFSPFSSQGYTSPWRPIDGANELVWCLIPLVLLTRLTFHVRGIRWPGRRVEAPITIPMRHN